MRSCLASRSSVSGWGFVKHGAMALQPNGFRFRFIPRKVSGLSGYRSQSTWRYALGFGLRPLWLFGLLYTPQRDQNLSASCLSSCCRGVGPCPRPPLARRSHVVFCPTTVPFDSSFPHAVASANLRPNQGGRLCCRSAIPNAQHYE